MRGCRSGRPAACLIHIMACASGGKGRMGGGSEPPPAALIVGSGPSLKEQHDYDRGLYEKT